MPSAADIIRDSIAEFSRVQNWMLAIEDKGSAVYQSMYDIYPVWKITLTALGGNLSKFVKIEA